jgi:hypothetical protein
MYKKTHSIERMGLVFFVRIKIKLGFWKTCGTDYPKAALLKPVTIRSLSIDLT